MITKRRAFTLVEVVIVAAILLILGGGLLTTLLTGQTSYLSAEAHVQVQEEARKAFDNMVRELREAGWGPIPPYKAPGIAGTATALDFQVALGYDLDAGVGAVAGCLDGAVCWGARDENGVAHYNWSVRYEEATPPNLPTQLIRRVLNEANVEQPLARRVLANNVDPGNTSFVWDSVQRTVTIVLQIRVTNSKLPTGSRVIGPLTSRIRLRNP